MIGLKQKPLDIRGLVAAIRRATRNPRGRVELLPPYLNGGDKAMVAQCLDRNPFGYEAIKAFELLLQAKTGRRHAVAVSSGTAAIHLALKALGIGVGDEVLVPDMTFAAAAAAVVYCGAIPHFIDCGFVPFGGVNAFKLRQHLGHISLTAVKRIKAVMAVDLLGHPGVQPETIQVCREFNLPLIEDAAAALGSEGFYRKGGGSGIVSILSFNNNKIVTTGGGGAVLTDDNKIADRVSSLSATSKLPSQWHYVHNEVGFNYRMPNVCAAVGLEQLGRLEAIVGAKRELHASYKAEIGNVDGFELVTDAGGCASNMWLNAVMIDPRYAYHADEHREATLKAITHENMECRAMFTPLSRLPPYIHYPKQADLGVSRDIFRRTICLPSGVAI